MFRPAPAPAARPHALTLLERLHELRVVVRRAPAMVRARLRRVAPEHLLGAVMIAALGLFLFMLFTGSTSTGRGGR